jgi:hypothetical protein
MAAAVNRLQAGLPAMDNAIKRTQNILQGGMEEKAGAEVDLAMTGIQQAADGVTEIASQSEAVANQLEDLQQALLKKGVSQSAITKSVEMLKSLKESALHWQDVRDSYNAGTALGTSLQGATTNISQQYQAFNKFLGDSGIYNALGNQTAEAAAGLLGPEAVLATKVTEVVTDVGYALGKGYLAQQDINNAQQTLASLSESRSRITYDIDSLNTSIGQFCAPQTAANPPSSPPPYIPPPVQSSTSTSSGTNWAPWIIGGTLLVGGAIAAGVYAGSSGGGGSSGSAGGSSMGFCYGPIGCTPGGGSNPCGCSLNQLPCSACASGNEMCLTACPGNVRRMTQRQRVRTSLEELGFERFLNSESLSAVGNEHRFAGGYGAGIDQRTSIYHRTAHRRIRANVYSPSYISPLPGVALQDRAGADPGLNGSSLPSFGGQDRAGTASGTGGFSPTVTSMYVPSWSQQFDDHWAVNGTASPSWSGAEPTLAIERQLDSGGSIYGEYTGNYSYRSIGGQSLGAGAECPITNSQLLDFGVGADLNGTADRFIRFQYSLALDDLL